MMQHISIAKISLKELFQIRNKDKAYEITINPKFGGYQTGLISMAYKFLARKQDQEQQEKLGRVQMKS